MVTPNQHEMVKEIQYVEELEENYNIRGSILNAVVHNNKFSSVS